MRRQAAIEEPQGHDRETVVYDGIGPDLPVCSIELDAIERLLGEALAELLGQEPN